MDIPQRPLIQAQGTQGEGHQDAQKDQHEVRDVGGREHGVLLEGVEGLVEMHGSLLSRWMHPKDASALSPSP